QIERARRNYHEANRGQSDPRGLIPRSIASPHEIAAHYKGQGLTAGQAHQRFLAHRGGNPELQPAEFKKIFDRAPAVPIPEWQVEDEAGRPAPAKKAKQSPSAQPASFDYPTKRERADLHVQAPQNNAMAGVLNRARAAQQGRSKAAQRIKQLRSQPVRAVATHALHFDPQRFQYKLGASAETGSVGSLHGVSKWDPARAGVVQVWKDPADGKTYVVNGHNRLAKAKQLGVKSINAMHLDAKDANEAKNIGALTNIAEGRGNSMDAAKFMRGMGVTSKEDFARHDLPLRESVATEGLALAGLPEHHFNRVVQGELPAHHAAIIGGSGLPHSRQAELFKLYDSLKGNVGSGKIHAWVNNAHAASATKGKEQSLFGDDAEEQSDFLHRSNLDEHVMRRLGEEKSAFGAVSKQKRADLLAKGGNTIDTAASGQLADQARENHAIYKSLNNTSVFSRLKGEHARRLSEAKGPKQRAAVLNDYYNAVQDAAKSAYNL
ncbi:MAG TPA: hypothetical protein PLB88_04695, partial [Thermoanaerobaculaceae bacterium]|nr:hypothetical protein [Thermoanaerobaculaceae bacterium]